MPRLRCQRGSALILVLFLLTFLGFVLTAISIVGHLIEQQRIAFSGFTSAAAAADAAIAIMTDRLAATVALRLGSLMADDLDALNAGLTSLPMHPGLSLDLTNSGYRVTAVTDVLPDGSRLRIPHDEEPLAVWTHQPRLRYDAIPPVGGLTVSRQLEITLDATAVDASGARTEARQVLALAQIAPYQEAIYTQGTAEMCAYGTLNNSVGGLVRADGGIDLLGCTHPVHYVGGLEATGNISVTGAERHISVGTDGEHPVTQIPETAARTGPTAFMDPWGGRIRVSTAVGGRRASSRLQSRELAGSGECPDQFLACGGDSGFSPSATFQRTTRGAGSEYSITCGVAYANIPCEVPLRGAVTYLPWPFAGPQPLGLAAPDPARPGYLWRGLFPDPRRAARCTATYGSNQWRSARCPTNAYGFTLDLAALPAVPGGLLAFRRARDPAPGSDPSGHQEVLLIQSAHALAGPLTIVSELDVFIAGNFNIMPSGEYWGPPPAMIRAPRITLLPEEAPRQLRTTTVWDSVAAVGASTPAATALTAASNVTVYAVLRSGYCRSMGAKYFGGSWEGIPAVLGDWSGVSLRVVGAVQGIDETSRGEAYCEAAAAPLNVVPPGRTPASQPLSRGVVHDERLFDPRFQPPGSWSSANTPASGWPGTTRTRQRQTNAFGGMTVLRLVRPTSNVSAPLPEPLEIPPLPELPPAEPPLPLH